MSRLKKRLEGTDLDLQDLFDDNIEDKIISPEEERKKKIQHRTTALAMLLAVVVIGAAIVFSAGDKDKKDADKKSVRETGKNPVETTQDATANALEDDEYPEITELVQLYYDAKLTGDTASIEKYVDNIEEVNMDQIKASNKYVKKYENIECFTKMGLYDNTYVVYAYYEIKFNNIDTLAPGIDVLYVIRDEETGSVYIHNGATANADIKNYIEVLSQEDDVKALYDKTNQALQEALTNDSALNDFYKALQQGTVDAKEK